MTGWPAPSAPVAQAQAAALRTAFPAYAVKVITWWDGKPRLEVVARDTSASPYCLISTDVREIWRELRQARP